MNILFITSTRIGDAVLSTGLLEHMREAYPEARVTVACGVQPAPLFEGFPNVEDVIAVKKEKRGGHWTKLWKQMVGHPWDMVVDLRNSVVSRLLFVKKRYVFGGHIDRKAHKVEQAAAVMKLEHVPDPKLYFTDEQKAFADGYVKQGERVIGVGPSANWIGKTWPAERFSEVVAFLTAADGPFPDAKVAVFAAPGEEAQAQPVLESVSEARRVDVIAKGNPGEAAAVIGRCQFYIGNDSGLMHCAAASAVPTFGVFGPSWPHLYRPWGAHTGFAQTPESFDELTDFDGYDPKTLDRSLMVSLDVETVKAALQDFFANQKAA